MSSCPASYTAGATVHYVAPTNTKGSRWTATINRGNGAANRWRATVPFADGPDAAIAQVLQRFNECLDCQWVVKGQAMSLDGGDTYAYPIGPA